MQCPSWGRGLLGLCNVDCFSCQSPAVAAGRYMRRFQSSRVSEHFNTPCNMLYNTLCDALYETLYSVLSAVLQIHPTVLELKV